MESFDDMNHDFSLFARVQTDRLPFLDNGSQFSSRYEHLIEQCYKWVFFIEQLELSYNTLVLGRSFLGSCFYLFRILLEEIKEFLSSSNALSIKFYCVVFVLYQENFFLRCLLLTFLFNFPL